MKNLDMKIDENLNCKKQISDIAIMLNKADDILSKLRHFMDRRTLKSIITQYLNPTNIVFQKKSCRIIYLKNHNAHTFPYLGNITS